MTRTVAIRAVIRGRVQGVSYRAWTQVEAERRGLSGWVRNRPDGAVEAEFSGPAEAVAAMLAACRTGPPKARVDTVETEPVAPVPGPAGFRIER